MRIGSIELPNNLILAPMAGVTDLPFRLLSREMGAGLVCMEMISAKALFFRNRNTKALLKTDPTEKPVSLQLFGSDPELIADMALRLEEEGQPFDILDINMGCPVPKVVKNGEGSFLMRDPLKVEKIVSAVASKLDKPVTVKIRKGWDETEVNAVDVAKAAEAGGAAAVAVHGRTREQFYSGKADWEIIREVKENISIPVIGNGDVTDPASARAIAEQTGCDGIMIGRAARGNPWIFRRILEERASGIDPGEPSVPEVRDMILRHAQMLIEEKGVDVGMREMRKHAAWYTTGFRHASQMRSGFNSITTLEELQGLLDSYIDGAAVAGLQM